MPDQAALSERETEVVRGVLRATVEGPFFPDWEFHALMGLERNEIGSVLAEWPDVVNRDIADLAVNNAFANLLGYPHGQWPAWGEFSDATPDEVARVFASWRRASGQPAPSSHFRDLA